MRILISLRMNAYFSAAAFVVSPALFAAIVSIESSPMVNQFFRHGFYWLDL
jgi:hypothetical protein